jgi:hypothetical protein
MESVEAHCFIANSINARVTLTRSLSLLPHQSENVLPIKRTLNRLENGTVVTVASRDQEVPGFRPYFVFSAILSLFFSKITLFFGAKDRSRSSETSASGEVIAGSLTPPRRRTVDP